MGDRRSHSEVVQELNRRCARVAVPGAVIGLCIAYPALVWAKLQGTLSMSWKEVIFLHAGNFAGILAVLAFIAWTDLRSARKRDAKSTDAFPQPPT